MKTLFIVGIALAAIHAAIAYPTLTGTTGLLLVPTAQVAPAGQLQVAGDLFYPSSRDAEFPTRAVYGIHGNWEIGAAYDMSEASGSDPVWGVFAKCQIAPNYAGAAWALGAGYFDSEEQNALAVNLSATKALSDNLSATASLLWNDVDSDKETVQGQFIADEDTDFILGLGVETTLNNRLTLIGEYLYYLPGDSLNIAARYPLNESWTAQLGFVDGLDNVTLGANYTFGSLAD